jgi:hypothetical protein
LVDTDVLVNKIIENIEKKGLTITNPNKFKVIIDFYADSKVQPSIEDIETLIKEKFKDIFRSPTGGELSDEQIKYVALIIHEKVVKKKLAENKENDDNGKQVDGTVQNAEKNLGIDVVENADEDDKVGDKGGVENEPAENKANSKNNANDDEFIKSLEIVIEKLTDIVVNRIGHSGNAPSSKTQDGGRATKEAAKAMAAAFGSLNTFPAMDINFLYDD